MPFENGQYIERSEDVIASAIEDELQENFGENIDLTESSVFTTLTEVLGTVLSENQEQSIGEVYRSAFVETAEGADLDRVVSLLGLQRRDAVHSTGVQRFLASGKVTQDRVIQKGTEVQTEGADTVRFETTESAKLELINNFEDGTLTEFSGDTSAADIVSTNVYNGSNALRLDATDGAHIYDDSISIDQGTTLHAHTFLLDNTVGIITFAVQDNGVDYYQVAFDEKEKEVRLEVVENDSVTSTLDTLSVELDKETYYEAEIDWNITDNIGITVKDNNGNDVGTLGAIDNTYTLGGTGFKSGDGENDKYFDFYTTSARSLDIRALDGGAVGNVGAESLTIVPSPPAGVDATTNLYPTGDPDFFDTSGERFRIGQNEESDDKLRDRALSTGTGRGSATHDALVGNIINSIDDATSVKVFENKTEDDNTGSGGLPPHSFEAVVFGGSDADVAEAIFEKKAITSRDYGGVNGTLVTETVVAETNGQEREIKFSRPNSLDINLTLDLVINDSYIGDDELKDRITQYIGGTLTNNDQAVGLGASDDVVIDRVRDIVIGADDTGVVAFDNSVDGTPLETSPATSTVDGIEVIDVGAIEVAQTDATDTSITLNTREQ
ncbi:hypothetical protein HAPG_00021 [Halorubrum phage GNf2]|nr:hypothetical protein HAPG_00021 [Halorubrum phage GNf2]